MIIYARLCLTKIIFFRGLIKYHAHNHPHITTILSVFFFFCLVTACFWALNRSKQTLRGFAEKTILTQDYLFSSRFFSQVYKFFTSRNYEIISLSSKIQLQSKWTVRVITYVCTERIFDSRPFMYNKLFLNKLL